MQKKVYKQKSGDEREGGKSVQKSQETVVPPLYKIKQAEGEDFNIATCMNNFGVVENPYEKDTDSYFDSYAHFHIHEEMLKDRVLLPHRT